jgi:hypothetical protein
VTDVLTTSVPVIGALRRNTELGLVLLGGVITAAIYTLASLGRTASLPADIGPFLGVVLGLVLVAHLAPAASRPMPTGSSSPSPGSSTASATCSSPGSTRTSPGSGGVDDRRHQRLHRHHPLHPPHADLEQYRYTLMFVGLGLLLLPLVPGVGRTINGARHLGEPGPVSFQPGSSPRSSWPCSVASYLVEKRECAGHASVRAGPSCSGPPPLRTRLLAWGASLIVMFTSATSARRCCSSPCSW